MNFKKLCNLWSFIIIIDIVQEDRKWKCYNDPIHGKHTNACKLGSNRDGQDIFLNHTSWS